VAQKTQVMYLKRKNRKKDKDQKKGTKKFKVQGGSDIDKAIAVIAFMQNEEKNKNKKTKEKKVTTK